MKATIQELCAAAASLKARHKPYKALYDRAVQLRCKQLRREVREERKARRAKRDQSH